MIIDVVNESKNELPKYETDGSAGMDLRANLDAPVTLKPMERKIISTGIKIKLEKGYEAQIRPRSGLAAKHGITVLNTPGTIDSDYRGVIGVILINLSGEEFTINNGDRIAQMVISKYESAKFYQVDSLDDTERGDGGFGHTGVSDEKHEYTIPKPLFFIKKGWALNPNEKVVNSICKLLCKNDGECPCQNPGKTREERLCPCKEYRENDVCHCSLYVKIKSDSNE